MEVGLNWRAARKCLLCGRVSRPVLASNSSPFNVGKKQAGKSGNQEYGFVGFMLSEGRTALESRPHKYIGVEMLSPTSVCTRFRNWR
jgi:hypothetical protein